ncbi:hypothetical protein PRIC1_007398 [Phytophthora ramorum]
MFSSRGASQTAKSKRKAMNDIRFICLRLLLQLAIRSGPATIVLDSLEKKIQANSFEQYAGVDTISELEYHVVSILDSVDPKGDVLGDFGVDERDKELWRIHSVIGGLEIKKLVDVQLNWTALISRSSLPKETMIRFLEQRHELGDWVFPVLTEAELQARDQIQQFIRQVSCDTKQTDRQESAATTSDHSFEANSYNKDDSNYHPVETRDDGVSKTSEPSSLNLPT